MSVPSVHSLRLILRKENLSGWSQVQNEQLELYGSGDFGAMLKCMYTVVHAIHTKYGYNKSDIFLSAGIIYCGRQNVFPKHIDIRTKFHYNGNELITAG